MAAQSVVLPSGETLLLKSSFDVKETLEAFYTGGQIAFSEDGAHMFCSCNNALKVVEVDSGRTVVTFTEEDDLLLSLAVSSDGKFLMSSWRSLLIKQFDWEERKLVREWKALSAPVVSMDFDATSTLLATGGSNSNIKIFDCYKYFCTHSFKGCGGVVNLLKFHPDKEALQLLSAAQDNKIRVWDLQKNKCVNVLEGHVSAVTDLTFTHDHKLMISCGRDQVILLWHLKNAIPMKTITAFESLEGCRMLPSGVTFTAEKGKKMTISTAHLCCVAAGEKGKVSVWDMHTGQVLHHLQTSNNMDSTHKPHADASENEYNPNAIMWLHLLTSKSLLISVSADHNISMYNLKDLTLNKQYVGYIDEVLDVKLVGPEEGHLAVAANSSLLKVFDRKDFSCQLLNGHRDTILSLDSNSDGTLIVSGSKDNTIRLWQIEEGRSCVCIGVGRGHTHSVDAVAFSRTSKPFVMSGGTDRTIKRWKMRLHGQDKEFQELSVKYTLIAHDKDINSMDIAPNDKLVVTGSQDKTAKIWSVDNGNHIGTLSGHRRGIWCVKFSPVDQCIASSSADGTIKLWAVTDCSCVKTFEGHATSVVKVQFITRGMQLVSSSSDGLIKVWTIKNNNCVATLDGHEDKVWALTSSKDETLLISGGADSKMCLWKDITEQVMEESRIKTEEILLKEQELSNLLFRKEYEEAIGLAISLDYPRKLYGILEKILEKKAEEGKLKEIVASLRDDQLNLLMKYINNWNKNAKFCQIAQSTLNIIFKTRKPNELSKLVDIKHNLEGLLPYTERHYERLSKLEQVSAFVDYTWNCMKLRPLNSSETRNEASETLNSSCSFSQENQVVQCCSNVESESFDKQQREERSDEAILSNDICLSPDQSKLFFGSHDQMDQSHDQTSQSESDLIMPADTTTSENLVWMEDRTPSKIEKVEEVEQKVISKTTSQAKKCFRRRMPQGRPLFMTKLPSKFVTKKRSYIKGKEQKKSHKIVHDF